MKIDSLTTYRLIVLLIVSISSHSLLSETIFEETTAQSGVSYTGASSGIAWRDFDNNSYPDLWSGNHGGFPTLWINRGDGTFKNGNHLLHNGTSRDGHGVAWADFNNDGHADILEVTGAALGTGVGGNQLFVNQGGKLIEQAGALGLDYHLGRGRAPTWFDYDGDGLLDVLIMNQTRADFQGPSALFRNHGTGFSNVPDNAKLDIDKTAKDAFMVLTNIQDDLPMELLVFGSKPYSYAPRAFKKADKSYIDISKEIFKEANMSHVFDAVTGDFNGDLRPDILLPRYKYSSKIVPMKNGSYRTGIFNNGAQQRGVDIVTKGDLDISIHLPTIKWDFSNVFVGRNKINLEAKDKHLLSGTLSLSTSSSDVMGEPEFMAIQSRAIYIWYDQDGAQWRFRFTSPAWAYLQIEFSSYQAISAVTQIGFEADSTPQPVLLQSTDTNDFVDTPFPISPSCLAATSGDFDNDMDLDLFLVCTEGAANIPNVMYENTGQGKFVRVERHGAEGSDIGIGSKVATADYDNDGFLDLFVANGLEFPSPINRGPNQLFRNKGNDNHWIKLHLQGTKSNRDAIGAYVLVTAAGKTQLREQNGKSHFGAQDDIILHFGLGTSDKVSEIAVYWPSGNKQILRDVPANQTLLIEEINH